MARLASGWARQHRRNEVPLADIRVGLHLAALVPRDDGMAIEKLGTSPMIVNGQSVEVAVLSTGDEIVLGPYRIEVLETPEELQTAYRSRSS